MKQIFFAFIFCVIFFSASVSFAASRGKIIYIPIDNRPVNLFQVVEVAEKIGYEVAVPPDEILGSLESSGNPDELWKWLNENSFGANAAVISTDAMIYGSLVGSRKHNLTAEKIIERAKNFEKFKEDFPALPIYTFGSIMRTPAQGYKDYPEDPDYYFEYGARIFEFTALKDKSETEKLSRSEKKKFNRLEKEIPAEYLNDWFNRRAKNFDANKYFIDLTRKGAFNYFFLGCDDSAIFSQTHLESRHLKEYGKDLGSAFLQVASGVDELGMLMMSRAINNDLHEIPFVSVRYNAGTGSDTIPTFSNGKIKNDINDAIVAMGGLKVSDDKNADFVLAVNTNINGKTPQACFPNLPKEIRKDTREFMKIVDELENKNYKILVCDIATFNGSDNALMEQLRKNNLQFKINGYGGWNTATNSTGFLIGQGVLTKFMSERDKNSLLLTRYLDDWIYQANVRNLLADILGNLPGEGDYMNLKTKKDSAAEKATEMSKNFADENLILPSDISLKNLSVKFPWNRMFECDPRF